MRPSLLFAWFALLGSALASVNTSPYQIMTWWYMYRLSRRLGLDFHELRDKFNPRILLPDVYGPGGTLYPRAPKFKIVIPQMTKYLQQAISAQTIKPGNTILSNLQSSVKGVLAARNVDQNEYQIGGLQDLLKDNEGVTDVVKTTSASYTTPVCTRWDYNVVDWQATEDAAVTVINQKRTAAGDDPLDESDIRKRLIADFTEYQATWTKTVKLGEQHQTYIQNYQEILQAINGRC